jgi:type I restriction enzyme S subunit
MNSDSAVPGLNKDIALSIDIMVPKKEKVNEFNFMCSSLFAKIRLNINEIDTLEKLRDTLLPKLMNGEVRVKI